LAAACTHELWLDSFARSSGAAADDGDEARVERERQERKAEIKRLASQASWWRFAEVLWTMLPVVFAWPLWLVDPETFWSFVAVRIDYCGPTFVKLAQWLATRRDLFPASICIAFSGLHNQVAARWSVGLRSSEVENALRENEVTLQSIEPQAHASGSIAEVFFATLPDGTDVAIKCLRPGVKPLLEADLALLLRFSEWADQFEKVRLMGVRQAAEDFAEHVRMQTDFRIEASHLRRFRANFSDGSEAVRFPNPLYVTPEALVLTRETGQELSEVFKIHETVGASSSPSKAAPEQEAPLISLASLCSFVSGGGGSSLPAVPTVADSAARAEDLAKSMGLSKEVMQRLARQSMSAYMRMIFNDAFIHGDLHPGNIMLQLRPKDKAAEPASASGDATDEDRSSTSGAGLLSRLRGLLPKPFRRGREELDDPRFELVILDAGLAIPLPKEKVEVLRSLAISIIYGDFYRAAEILYEQSPDSSRCWDPVAFKRGLAQAFQDCRRNVWEEGFVQVSDACLRALQLVQYYNVGLDLTLTWTLFGMLSVEGSARQLDPEVDCARAATRYIITVPSLVKELRCASWSTIRHMLGELAFGAVGLNYWEFREHMGLTWHSLQQY